MLQYVYTWPILQFCDRSGPTGTFGNAVPPTTPRTQVRGGGGGGARGEGASESRAGFEVVWENGVSLDTSRASIPYLVGRTMS